MRALRLTLDKALTVSIINTIWPHHFGTWTAGPCHLLCQQCWIKQDLTDFLHRGSIQTDLHFDHPKGEHKLQSISIFNILLKQRLTFCGKLTVEYFYVL